MSLNLDSIRIHIVSWEKFNTRKDVKSPSWFRMQHDFFTNPHFYSFTAEEMVCWFYLLCEQSKTAASGTKNGLRVHANHFTVCTRVSEKVLHRTIKKLKEEQLITVRTLRGRHVDVTRTCPTDITNKHTPLPPEGDVSDWDLWNSGDAARGESSIQDTLQESSDIDDPTDLNLNKNESNSLLEESVSQEPPPPKLRSKVKESDFEKAENLIGLWNALKAPEMPAKRLPLNRAGKSQQDLVKSVIKALESYPDQSDWEVYIKYLAKQDWARAKTSIKFIANFKYLIRLSNIENYIDMARNYQLLNKQPEYEFYNVEPNL